MNKGKNSFNDNKITGFLRKFENDFTQGKLIASGNTEEYFCKDAWILGPSYECVTEVKNVNNYGAKLKLDIDNTVMRKYEDITFIYDVLMLHTYFFKVKL